MMKKPRDVQLIEACTNLRILAQSFDLSGDKKPFARDIRLVLDELNVLREALIEARIAITNYPDRMSLR